MRQTNYVQAVPDSHYWTKLEHLIITIDFDIKWHQRKKEIAKDDDQIMVDIYKPLTKEYLFIGLNNSLKNGYEIQQDAGYTTYEEPVFRNIQQIINRIEFTDLESPNGMEECINIIKNTIKNRMNLTNNKKMERKEVYDRLDTEREYQELQWSTLRTENGTPDEEKPVAEWINYMEYHISKAKEAVYHLKTKEALAEIRKVTALGVLSMEIHGCPERVIPPHLEK